MLLYKKELKPFVRQLRKDMTVYEQLLWKRIRCKQIHNVQFYRQKPIGTFIIDFYAKALKLAIEIDGGHHYTTEGIEKDKNRDIYLSSLSIKTLRFSNHEILEHIEAVLERIEITILALTAPSKPEGTINQMNKWGQIQKVHYFIRLGSELFGSDPISHLYCQKPPQFILSYSDPYSRCSFKF